MARLLRMPEVAANVEEAVLQEWAVAANVPFAAQDAIAVVETDKAVVEIPAPEAGVILTQLVGAGEIVAVGTPIAVLGGLGEQVGDLAELLAELGVAVAGAAGDDVAGDDAARAGEAAGAGAGGVAGVGEAAGSGAGGVAGTGEAPGAGDSARAREAAGAAGGGAAGVGEEAGSGRGEVVRAGGAGVGGVAGTAEVVGAGDGDSARAREVAEAGGGDAVRAGELAGAGVGGVAGAGKAVGAGGGEVAGVGEVAGSGAGGVAGTGEVVGSGGGDAVRAGELAGADVGAAAATGKAAGPAGSDAAGGGGVTRAGEPAGSGGGWVARAGEVAGSGGGGAARAGEVAGSGAGETAGPDVGEVARAGEVAGPSVAASGVGPGSAAAAGNVPGGRKFASPLARRMAKEAGLAIEVIAGTGPGGRVVRRDVEAMLAHRASAPAEPIGGDEVAAASEAPEVVSEPAGEVANAQRAYTDVPHSRVRRAIANRLTESVRNAPHFYLRATVRVDKLLKLRSRLDNVSVNDLLLKAACHAHVQVPAMNVIWTPGAVRCFESVDIAVAVATERGLVTPVVREVERRSISDLARGTRDLAERARSGQLRQHELEGGTLTISNLGMYGTEEFSAIINPPHSAILAIGAARREAVVTKGRPAVATVIRCTLSVDHRPVDGVTAAQWLDVFVHTVERPLRILS